MTLKEQLKCYAIVTFVLLSSLWALLFIWIHQPIHTAFTYGLLCLWLLLSCCTIYGILKRTAWRSPTLGTYGMALVITLSIYFTLEPQNDRIWQDETEKVIQFQFKDGKVEIQNIRNFIWRSNTDYDIQWETRQYDLEQLNKIDLVVSHFIQGPVAHVFISFGFNNGEHLAFSLEVRQEHDEGFSTVGGFFRQYELALVVGDENDLIFTRSNIRDEDVYIYPIKMNQTEIQMLFLEYLNKANRLQHTPVWYNTYVSNCTTILFDLMEHAIGQIPRDYRVTLPGLIPNYLYDKKVLDNRISLKQWKEKAYINPKIRHIKDIEQVPNKEFSQLIRQ